MEITKTDENLIVLVQKYPCLYDMESAEYSDQHRKENAWEEIGKIINLRGKYFYEFDVFFKICR